jgi:uncharacterized protein YidB (DUF937 family)
MDFGYGLIPDLLRGKDFKDALVTNAKQGAMAGLAFFGLPQFGSAVAPTTTATNPAIIESAVGTEGYGVSSATPAASGGLLGGMKGAMGSMKPYMEAAGAASQVKGLLGDGGSQPIQAPQVAQGNSGGAQTLMQLYQQGTQIPADVQARLQRKTMWG